MGLGWAGGDVPGAGGPAPVPVRVPSRPVSPPRAGCGLGVSPKAPGAGGSLPAPRPPASLQLRKFGDDPRTSLPASRPPRAGTVIEMARPPHTPPPPPGSSQLAAISGSGGCTAPPRDRVLGRRGLPRTPRRSGQGMGTVGGKPGRIRPFPVLAPPPHARPWAHGYPPRQTKLPPVGREQVAPLPTGTVGSARGNARLAGGGGGGSFPKSPLLEAASPREGRGGGFCKGPGSSVERCCVGTRTWVTVEVEGGGAAPSPPRSRPLHAGRRIILFFWGGGGGGGDVWQRGGIPGSAPRYRISKSRRMGFKIN